MRHFAVLSLLTTICVSSALNLYAQQIIVRMLPVVKDKALLFDTLIYRNATNQEFSVTRFRWYGTNIRCGGNTIDFPIADANLFDAEDSASLKTLAVMAPAGEYSWLSFDIGVDSLRNCTGVQEGALDPIHGMFWSWNSGYIFLKLEGFAPRSSAPGNKLEYHIGGFRPPAVCLRSVRLPFRSLHLTTSSTLVVEIAVDIAEIFDHPKSIDFGERPVVTDFHNAEEMADNYKDMFRIQGVRVIP